MLEIARYRHVLSYRLAKERGFEPTLFDVSDYDLEAGRQIAAGLGYPTIADRVAGEFHSLPFTEGYFDLVYVSAALHHTRQPERVISEAMRVLRDGGYFYCQREPVERMFCFYKFPGNRAFAHTELERHLLGRDIARIICSPFPGARNAIVFGRIENDRITLDDWLAACRPHGEIVEEVLYHDGLLTSMDKDIIGMSGPPERELKSYIRDRLQTEVHLARPKLSRRDELLGHSLPSDAEIDAMAARVAQALKARHPNEKTQVWGRAMARIFGASSRFLVRRKRGDGLRSPVKYRREITPKGYGHLDDKAYEGVLFWNRLLPDLATADRAALQRQFPSNQWKVVAEHDGMRVVGALGGRGEITPAVEVPAVLAMRYQVTLDDALPVARLKVFYGGRDIADLLIPQTEDRVLKVLYDKPETAISLQLCDEHGTPLNLPSRIRVSVLQAVPIT